MSSGRKSIVLRSEGTEAMQATLDIPTVNPPRVSEDAAQRAADTYLADALGPEYHATNGAYQRDRWTFFICCRRTDLQHSCVVGRVSIDARTGVVLPLTGDQLREVREVVDWEVARGQGELARDANGYLSRHQARRLARRWLDQHLSMKYGASGGLLIPLDPPVWQFSITFRLQALHLEPLGLIDVDAVSGAVKPLTTEQLAILQERVRAVIQSEAPTAAA
jgi:hypothetical protein